MTVNKYFGLTLFLLISVFFSDCKEPNIQTDVEKEGETVFPFGVIRTIQSADLNEKRVLNIYLPNGYHSDSAKIYPVVYVLDGSANEDFPHIAGLVQFLNMYAIMPNSIVVGIANVDRYRDFTHETNSEEDLERLPTGGGSEAFINFLENELIPYIDLEFNTDGHNTIIGQSMGGLLVAELLLKKPHLIKDYIIVSPSLWWDDQSLVNSAPTKLKTQDLSGKQVFLSLGTEPDVMHETANKLAESINEFGGERVKLFYEPLLEEDHATILHRAVYKAFERLNSN